MIQLTVKGMPRTQSDIVNRHVRAKERRGWRRAACVAANQAGHLESATPLKKAHLVFDCYRTDEPDDDNLRWSVKSIRDGLQPGTQYLRRGKWVIGIGCGMILNDSPSCIGKPDVFWHKCKRGEERVVITVREIVE